MDPTTTQTVASIALAGVGVAGGAVLWAIRLEGRLTTHEKTDELHHQYIAQEVKEIKETTQNMDSKIDRLLMKR